MRKPKPPRKGINPRLGVTDGHLRSQVRSSLRKVWRNSSRRVFIQSKRYKYEGPKRFKYAVKCVECGCEMGQSEKVYMTKKDGTRTKRKTLAYQVDHLGTNHKFLDIKTDLGPYAHTLLYGDMQILCIECHTGKTVEQIGDRTAENQKKEAEMLSWVTLATSCGDDIGDALTVIDKAIGEQCSNGVFNYVNKALGSIKPKDINQAIIMHILIATQDFKGKLKHRSTFYNRVERYFKQTVPNWEAALEGLK